MITGMCVHYVALQDAFYDGEWGKMNARDRGNLMYR